GVRHSSTVLRHERRAWTVAGRAVTRTFHQVLTTDLLIIPCHGLEVSLARQRQPVPCTDTKAHVERKAEAGGLYFVLHRSHFCLQVVEQRSDVAFLHEAVVLIRHGWGQLLTVAAHAIPPRSAELLQCPGADTSFFVWRDVGSPDGSH